MAPLQDREHLSHDVLILLMDDELSAGARRLAEAHLAGCPLCRAALAGLRQFSSAVGAAVQSMPLPAMDGVRESLQQALETNPAKDIRPHQPGHVMRRFGWGMALAASLAFGILLMPRHDLAPRSTAGVVTQANSGTAAAAIEVDGETFQPVPDANADLATAAPHIVQMQVPVSSLADIGIVLEPVTARVGSSNAETDRSVLADVLLGADGQPRGVHVIGLE